MAQAVQQLETVKSLRAGQTAFHVAIDKDRPDSMSPWWLDIYFRYAFRWFLRFSFWLGVPTPCAISRHRKCSKCHEPIEDVTWWEHVSICLSADEADTASTTPSHVVTPLIVGEVLPGESVQRGGQYRPRAQRPYRQAEPVFPLVPIRRTEVRAELETLREVANNLSTILTDEKKRSERS